jgi:hypothetical protein
MPKSKNKSLESIKASLAEFNTAFPQENSRNIFGQLHRDIEQDDRRKQHDQDRRDQRTAYWTRFNQNASELKRHTRESRQHYWDTRADSHKHEDNDYQQHRRDFWQQRKERHQRENDQRVQERHDYWTARKLNHISQNNLRK